MSRIPSSSEIDQAAAEMGLVDTHGKVIPKHRAAVAKAIVDAERTPPPDDPAIEDLHEVVIRFDNKLHEAHVHHTVRAAAVGALVANITAPHQVITESERT